MCDSGALLPLRLRSSAAASACRERSRGSATDSTPRGGLIQSAAEPRRSARRTRNARRMSGTAHSLSEMTETKQHKWECHTRDKRNQLLRDCTPWNAALRINNRTICSSVFATIWPQWTCVQARRRYGRPARRAPTEPKIANTFKQQTCTARSPPTNDRHAEMLRSDLPTTRATLSKVTHCVYPPALICDATDEISACYASVYFGWYFVLLILVAPAEFRQAMHPFICA